MKKKYKKGNQMPFFTIDISNTIMKNQSLEITI